MRDAELHFAGPIDKKGGAKDKTGKLRGAYLVGGISQREAERRRAAARKQQEESNGRLGPERLESQYIAIRKLQSAPARENQSIKSFFITTAQQER